MTAQGGVFDLFVIGGGVNGAGIARDAAGRGQKVVLAEQGDLASATSSASTKLFHGGLRYLEHHEYGLVRKALKEREVLLQAMPHISWPLRFVLPHTEGLRPRWMLRAGLFLYDHLGGRRILPATRSLDLTRDPAGAALRPGLTRGFEYSDCWVDDARLVVLNAVDAARRGATVLTRARVSGARRLADHWEVEVTDSMTGATSLWRAKALVNATGPWVSRLLHDTLGLPSQDRIRLVRGSHVVVPRLFTHDRAYTLQGSDGRVVFAIPYEQDFTLIGTTDRDHGDDPAGPECTDEEVAYLCATISGYLARPVTPQDVVWRYAGVRPLHDDGSGAAQKATRDYAFTLDTGGPPLLSVYGGKITTYRKLAEAALAKLAIPGGWTAGAPLPGGDFPWDGAPALAAALQKDYPFLDAPWAARLVRLYGTEARALLGKARTRANLGRDFGATLTEAELVWLRDNEFARTGEDVLWRRTKLGLRLTAAEAQAVSDWFEPG
ncbi:MAG: glycerol-3-phosphate dehydrogenase [Rhodobacterales bacterium]|nr:MAG: glycerol-3-phosphate dehydrogenase [Rhodobacterales bacterium]